MKKILLLLLLITVILIGNSAIAQQNDDINLACKCKFEKRVADLEAQVKALNNFVAENEKIRKDYLSGHDYDNGGGNFQAFAKMVVLRLENIEGDIKSLNNFVSNNEVIRSKHLDGVDEGGFDNEQKWGNYEALRKKYSEAIQNLATKVADLEKRCKGIELHHNPAPPSSQR